MIKYFLEKIALLPTLSTTGESPLEDFHEESLQGASLLCIKPTPTKPILSAQQAVIKFAQCFLIQFRRKERCWTFNCQLWLLYPLPTATLGRRNFYFYLHKGFFVGRNYPYSATINIPNKIHNDVTFNDCIPFICLLKGTIAISLGQRTILFGIVFPDEVP